MIFAKFFEKKPNEKNVVRFWKEFDARSEFYLDVLKKDGEDSEDYIFVISCVKEGLRKCCIDATVPFDFTFNKECEPMRFVFHHYNDRYLQQAGECLLKQFPATLKDRITFLTAE